MPTNRTRRVRHAVPDRITSEAVQAWRSGDYWRLHRALGLKLWQMPMWNEDPPEEPWKVQPLANGPRYPDPAELKAQLIEAGGPPPRRWVFKHAD